MYFGLGGGGIAGVLGLLFWGMKTLDRQAKQDAQGRRRTATNGLDVGDGSFLPRAPR
jgi:hypothetical protein